MTDWLMVIITAVYVIATIAICAANFRTAKIAQEQLKESKEQFNITQRLLNAPFLQLENDCMLYEHKPAFSTDLSLCSDDEDADATLINLNVKFKNIGNGTARNLTYTWECQSLNISDTDCMPINAIRAGAEYNWMINIDVDIRTIHELKTSLVFQYSDLLETTYTQSMYFSFSEDEPIIENDDPVYKGMIGYSLADEQ